MIIVRSQRKARLRIALLTVCFALGFLAGSWRAMDHGEAASAIAAVEKLERLAAKIEARIAATE